MEKPLFTVVRSDEDESSKTNLLKVKAYYSKKETLQEALEAMSENNRLLRKYIELMEKRHIYY